MKVSNVWRKADDQYDASFDKEMFDYLQKMLVDKAVAELFKVNGDGDDDDDAILRAYECLTSWMHLRDHFTFNQKEVSE